MSRRQRSEAECVQGLEGRLETDRLGEECNNLEFDAVAWAGFTRIFQQVQYLLDHNRVLIGSINQNHQSGISDRIASNVDLINQLNRNLSKVHKLYASAADRFNKSFSDAPIPEDADKTAHLRPGIQSESAVVTESTLPGELQRLVPSESSEGS